jgi:sec-independent protein translocase protein TatB
MDKLAVIAVIAVFLVGPQRLPGYAAQLARLVKAARALGRQAQDRLRDELGPDFDEVDWKKLDPRQYDPRRIIRDALADELVSSQRTTAAVVTPAPSAQPPLENQDPTTGTT